MAKKILVPLDGSPLAEAALPAAIDLSSGATLLLLRAAEAHTLPGADPTEAQVEVVREAEAYLARVEARLRSEGVEDITASVWYGNPVSVITEAAQLHGVDMIVMTTHGRSGLGRLVLGSVAESVIRSSRIPILIIRPTGAPLADAWEQRAHPVAAVRHP